MARMWAGGDLVSMKNPQGTRRFHAHLFATSGAASASTVTVENSDVPLVLTHPLERQESPNSLVPKVVVPLALPGYPRMTTKTLRPTAAAGMET